MAMTGLAAFDSTLQETHEWLNEISEQLSYGDRRDAYSALRATLFALRDRLTLEEAVHLGDQLPMLICGIYYESWRPSVNPRNERTPEEFLGAVQQNLRFDIRMDAERIAQAVFDTLCRRISKGEVDQIVGQLPKKLRSMLQ